MSWSGSSSRYVAPSGSEPCRFAFVGEAPGRDEDRSGFAFTGRGGDLLWQFSEKYAGLSRDDVWVHNLWPYWPGPGNPDPDEHQQAQGRDWLLKLLTTRVQPELVVALGRISASALLGREVVMERDNGLTFWSEAAGCPLIPVQHPAAGLHSADMLKFTVRGLEAVDRWIHHPSNGRQITDSASQGAKYALLEGVEAVARVAFKVRPKHGHLKLAIDTEGSAKNPFCLTFSFGGETPEAWAILATDVDGLSAFRGYIVAASTLVTLHSALHDIPVLRMLGIDLVAMGVPLRDTMIDAYLLQDEPQGLKALGYRHLSLRMRDFEDVTGPYAVKDRIKYLSRAEVAFDEVAAAHLIVEDRWGKRKFRDGEELPRKPLKPKTRKCRCDTCKAGSLVRRAVNDFADRVVADAATTARDMSRRWRNWDDARKASIVAASGMQPWPTLELSRVPQAEWLPYACDDAWATAEIDPVLDARVDALELSEVRRLDLAVMPMVERMHAVGMAVDESRIPPLLMHLRAEKESARRMAAEILDWEDFNPASGDQCSEALFERLHLPPVKLTKSRTRWSSDDKVLQELALLLETTAGEGDFPPEAQHVIRCITRYREHDKLEGTYVEPLPGFLRELQPGHLFRRCHPQLRTTRVVSGRLSSFDPNLLAFPSKTPLGRRCRSLFVTEPGLSYFSVDLSQIELRVMAEESGDAAMIAAFLADEDLHARTAALMFNIDLAAVTKEQRYAAKTLNFAILYGITPEGLYAQFRLSGLSFTLDECRDLIRRWFAAYPMVVAYLRECWRQTRLDGFVRELGGRIRWLPAIYLRGEGWPFEFLRGEAERQAGNHRIQGGAQTALKRRMVVLQQETLPWLRRRLDTHIEIVLQVHDELIGETETWAADYVAQAIRRVMEERLPGEAARVPFKATVAVAADWGSLEK